MKHAIALSLVLFGCVDQSETGDDLAATAQALNGDTWTPADNDSYPGGLGATFNAIAVSQATGKVFVAGARTETSGLTTWIVRGSASGTSFQLNHSFTLGGSARATAAVSDASGNVFVAGEAIDASNVPHFIVRKTADNGQSWTTVVDRSFVGSAHAVPTSMSLDGWDLVGVFVTGTITSATGAAQELTLRAPSGAAAFADFSAVAGRAPTAVCVTFNGTALAATLPAVGSQAWNVSATTNADPTWDFTTPTLPNFVPASCSYSTIYYNTLVGGSAAGGTEWLLGQIAADGTPQVGGLDQINGAAGTGIRAQMANLNRLMTVGAVTPVGGTQKWRVRFTTDPTLVTWLDSDSYALAAGKPSVATAITHDGPNLNGRIFYVAGDAVDANNRHHGIVRRLAP